MNAKLLFPLVAAVAAFASTASPAAGGDGTVAGMQGVIGTLAQSVQELKVTPRGTFVDVTWKQRYASKKAAVELWEGGKVRFQAKTSESPTKHWQIRVTHLRPGTAYELKIRLYGDPTGAKPIYTHPDAVKTLKRKVTVNFLVVQMHDDSDPMSCGEFTFDFLVGPSFNAVWNNDLCDGSAWIAGKSVVAGDVKDDIVVVRAFGADNDEIGGAYCGGFAYATCKNSGEWSEGAVLLDLTPDEFTIAGESLEGTVAIEAKGGSGDPHFTWTAVYSVSYV